MVTGASGWSRWLKWLISMVVVMYPFFSQAEGPSVDKPYPRSINVFFSGNTPLSRYSLFPPRLRVLEQLGDSLAEIPLAKRSNDEGRVSQASDGISLDAPTTIAAGPFAVIRTLGKAVHNSPPHPRPGAFARAPRTGSGEASSSRNRPGSGLSGGWAKRPGPETTWPPATMGISPAGRVGST